MIQQSVSFAVGFPLMEWKSRPGLLEMAIHHYDSRRPWINKAARPQQGPDTDDGILIFNQTCPMPKIVPGGFPVQDRPHPLALQ